MSKKQRKQSKAFVVSNSTKKRVSGFLAGVLLVGGLLTPKYEAHAHKGYFLAVLPDVENFSYQALVSEDDKGNEKEHAEFQFLDGKLLVSGSGKKKLPTTIQGYMDGFESYFGLEGEPGSYKIKGDSKCYYTFPTCDTKGNSTWWDAFTGLFSKDGDATDADRVAASTVSQTLIKSINTALGYISRTAMNTDGTKWVYGSLGDAKRESFITITSQFANKARAAAAESRPTKKITVGATKYSIKWLTTDEEKSYGIKNTDPDYSKYMLIQADNDPNGGAIFQYSMPRYPANPSISNVSGASKTLTVFNLIALGNTSYVFGGVSTTNIESVYNPSFVEQILVQILEFLLSGIRSIFGLHSMGDLMFNSGSYGTETFKGIAPVSWFQGADVIFWVSQAFAWLLLAFASLKFFGIHMWSTVTPLTRVSLMNGIQNVLITAFCLTMIVPIFHVVTEFNYLIVDVLKNTSMFNDQILSGNAFPPTLAGVILGFIFFFAELLVNFIYILRGATIALLYGTSPLFVVAFAFGERYQGITLKFIKELIGNIFIQTFHAIILTFYGLFMFTGASGNFLVNLVMIFAFIPITKVFKDITGIGESGFIQGVADTVKGHTVNTAKYTGKGMFDSVAGDKAESFMKQSKDKYQPKTDDSANKSSEFSTSTYEKQKNGELNSAQNQRSIGDSVGSGNGSTGSGGGGSASGGGSTEDNSATLANGGGMVNEFGKGDFGHSSTPSLSKRDKAFAALKSGGKVVGGTAQLAGGMALGALGGATGSKLLSRAARNMAGQGQSNIGGVASAITSPIGNKIGNATSHAKHKAIEMWNGIGSSNGNVLIGESKKTDYDANGNHNSEIHTYNGQDAYDQGIVSTSQAIVDGRQCLVQEFGENSEIYKQLQDIKFDPSTGIVTDEKALAAGFTHVSKTDDGNYRVSMDMEKIGVRSARSYAGGSRYEIKTATGKGTDNMNYAERALENMKNSQSQSKPQPNPNEQVS